MLKFQRFFQTAESGSGGESGGDAGQQGSGSASFDRMAQQVPAQFDTGMNLPDLFKANNINLNPDQAEQPGSDQPDNDQASGQANESAGTDQSAQQTSGEGKEGQQQKEGDAAIIDLTGGEAKYRFKIGDKEIGAKELLEYQKSYQAQSDWIKKLNGLSIVSRHYLNNLSDQEQERFLQYGFAIAKGKEKLPDDYKPRAISLDVEGKDEDDLPVKLKHIIEPDSKEYKAIREQFYKEFMQEHGSVFKENVHLKQEREDFIKQQSDYIQQAGAQQLRDFLKSKNVRIPLEGDLMATIRDSYAAGPTSPFYADASRIVAAHEIATNGSMSFGDAWSALFGASEAESAEAAKRLAKDKKNESGTVADAGRGSSAKQGTELDKFLGSIRNRKDAAIHSIVNDMRKGNSR